jgi:hydrogenase maturation protein HypF
VRMMAGREVLTRSARGYACAPLAFAAVSAPILALGGQQKNAVAIGFAGHVTPGPHIGDLTGARTREAFARCAASLPALHGIKPIAVACDTHPDYHSTSTAWDAGLPVTQVPHHLAHVLSCMVDNGLDGPVLGVAWDGTGYGGDSTVWGGECLAVDAARFRRVAHLRHFRLPGGEAAVREPRRAALGLLHAMNGTALLDTTALPPVAAFTASQRAVLARMLDRGINAPLCSSAGRLFDATAALLGLCQVASFEGEAAMALEFAAGRAGWSADLPRAMTRATAGPIIIDWQPLFAALVAARLDGMAPEPLAAALHDRLIDAIVSIAEIADVRNVVLTGGCFQNVRLTERAVDALRAAGFCPYWHHLVPPNDGGLAVGQIAFAARPLLEEKM